MSNFSGFLKPTYTSKTVEVAISDRFLDDEGNPLKFKLKTLSREELNLINKRSMRDRKVGGQTVQELDQDQFINRCLVESCISPDFKDKELCSAYGTLDPVECPNKMLLVSEYEALGRAFLELNGLNSSEIDFSAVTKN